jgi:hypothetical protein
VADDASAGRTPTAPAHAVADGLVTRLRKRMFDMHAPKVMQAPAVSKTELAVVAPVVKSPKREVSFQASLAEFLLINRLRARRKAVPSADVLERGARILQVTCKHWFAQPKPPVSGTPRTRL